MENASKALLMAGGVLIAILILTVVVILFNTYGQLAPTYEKELEENEIKKFNSNFTKFEGREDITIQEIVTLTNFAKQYEEKTETTVEVFFSATDLTEKDEDYLINLIKDNSTISVASEEKIKYFKCVGLEYEYGKVNVIKFQ